MTRFWAFLLILVFLVAGYGAAHANDTGIIKTKSGTVHLVRNGRQVPALPAMPLKDKDIIMTGTRGFAGLLFKDGTVITLGPSSEFTIQTYIFEPKDHAYFFSFFMNKGSLIYNSGRIGKLSPQSVRLATPKATVGIRGTRFIVDLD